MTGDLAADGYAVLEGFLDEDALTALRREVEAVVRKPSMPGCDRPHNRLVPLRWNDAAVDLILAGEWRRRAVTTVAKAADLRWISAYVSVKPAHSQALWWHQDWWCWSHPVTLRAAPPQVAVLVYLSPTSTDTGALRVLPGSHRAGLPLHAALPHAHAMGAAIPPDHPAMSDQPGQATLAATPGDAVMLDYRLLHGTHPNTSPRRRDAVLLSFTPDWAGLPRDVRAHLIRHPALPAGREHPPPAPWRARLLPEFAGPPADLELDRTAPAALAVRR